MPKEAADRDVDAALRTFSSEVQAVLTEIAAIDVQAMGHLPFRAVAERIQAVEEAAREPSRLLTEREREWKAEQRTKDAKTRRPSHASNPFGDRRIRLRQLTSELGAARKSFVHADKTAGNTLLILNGDAGTGKTHLLCDVASRRISAGRPTVLLMGQRFVSNDEPWSQALQQLDLPSLSAEKFVGALEAAAQAADSRALVLIDAINEGAGRSIWPSHLAAFLTRMESSPWIGVVLSVRSSFEDLVFPEDVRSGATVVTHSGFTGHEYDALRTFFVHYGLELPSTPLLAPEFQNPLFLMTLCRGLNAKGEGRLPRGFQGITDLFALYLDAINERLASSLDFDYQMPLVRQAVEAVAEAILDSDSRAAWLPLAKAKDVVNRLLPGRDFGRSLYRGLIAEGVLVESVRSTQDAPAEVAVFAAYERLADHFMARSLLSGHLDANDPAAAFSATGALAFICDKSKYVSPGLLEALCIQIPERIGQELISVAPKCAGRWGLGGAFRQSLVWRTYAAFSDDTRRALNELCRNEYDLHDTLDVLLTVASLPEHPLNAWFLDQRLRKGAMPDRDAWWSVYLHHAYGEQGAVDRLVDWAYSLDQSMPVDDEAVDLCAVALSWMLTTSNRFLRDRATTALVNLLTGRMAAVLRLVQRFADVDDPYVAERIYAVAYGAAMRCHDPVAVGTLATCVYEGVFAEESPPPHILLRDYARGVVERALHLGSEIEIVLDHVRPPYKSTWPTIPTEEDIKALRPDWSEGSHDGGDLRWARNRIGSSVLNDDFAFYVIGTNSSVSAWLSLKLDELPWTPSPRRKDLLRSLVNKFSSDELAVWKEVEAAYAAHAEALRPFSLERPARREQDDATRSPDPSDAETLVDGPEEAHSPEVSALEAEREQAIVALEAVLSDEHAERLSEILSVPENDYESLNPPRFDLAAIQRYVLWRVFDLGWTAELFGRFDQFSIRYNGREAAKAERIGKKYQWIAYHEIMALISDHYQYREYFREEEGDQAYEGPWQDFYRDIDPSCTLKSVPGGTSWDGHADAWWATARYDSWGDPDAPRDWVTNRNDFPVVERLLVVTNPDDGLRWLNGRGFFRWKQPTPTDRESIDVERRELWCKCTGYLIQAGDAETFLRWANEIDFWDDRMPEASSTNHAFLGEHAWAPASRYFEKPYYGDDGWHQPAGCPVKLRTVTREYLREHGGFDCSIDESYTLRLPDVDLVSGLGIRWSGRGADFVDDADRVAAQDPTVHSEGPSALLLREDVLGEFLASEKLTICWTVVGEKRVIPPGFGTTGPRYPWLRLSGAYILSDGHVNGFQHPMIDDPSEWK
ncbi:MAG: ATP-binding protein [Gammaproteobacteria bacterium]|nr:ATP-binding protein [Gammaproteobacteria bacterium]